MLGVRRLQRVNEQALKRSAICPRECSAALSFWQSPYPDYILIQCSYRQGKLDVITMSFKKSITRNIFTATPCMSKKDIPSGTIKLISSSLCPLSLIDVSECFICRDNKLGVRDTLGNFCDCKNLMAHHLCLFIWIQKVKIFPTIKATAIIESLGLHRASHLAQMNVCLSMCCFVQSPCWC